MVSYEILNGGDDDGTNIMNIVEPTKECRLDTEQIHKKIEVKDHKVLVEREFINHVTEYTDMRQIECGSPQPNSLECNFDWMKLFFTNDNDDDNDESDNNDNE